MRQVLIPMLISMIVLAMSNARAARVDTPEPNDGQCPVNNLTITEKNGKLTMTFRVVQRYHWSYVLKDVWFEDKDIKYKKTKNGDCEFSLTVSKDKVDSSILALSYIDPNLDKMKKERKTGGLNAVQLNLGKYYKHYKKK